MSDDRRRFSASREGRSADVTRAVSRALRRSGGIGLSIFDMIRDAKACRSKLWEWEATAALVELRALGLVDRSRADRRSGTRSVPPSASVAGAAGDGETTVRWYWRLDVPTPGSWRTSSEDLCREVDRVLDEVRRWDGGRWVRIEEVRRVVAGPGDAGAEDASRIEHGLERLYDAGLVEAYDPGTSTGRSGSMFRHTR